MGSNFLGLVDPPIIFTMVELGFTYYTYIHPFTELDIMVCADYTTCLLYNLKPPNFSHWLRVMYELLDDTNTIFILSGYPLGLLNNWSV